MLNDGFMKFGGANSFAVAYSSPSSGAPGWPFSIGAGNYGTLNNLVASGSKIWTALAFSAALNPGQCADFHGALNQRLRFY